MIKSIGDLKNLGIFRNFKRDQSLHDFSKYNLIYGWNGSGKSTISKLFSMLEKKLVPEEFFGCEFKFTLEDGTFLDGKFTNLHNRKVFVFNQDFINENINWNETVNSLLLVSEEKIVEHNKLDNLINQRNDLLKEQGFLSKTIATENKSRETFLSDSAKEIKKHFQVIDTSDNYYFNYNRTKIEKLIDDGKQLSQFTLLSADEVSRITKAVKPDVKEAIPNKEASGLISNIFEAGLRIDKLIHTSIVSYSIDRLRENSEISSWVEVGLEIHSTHNNEYCEFCGGPLKKDRIEELKKHFNDEYRKFKERLLSALQWVKDNKLNTDMQNSSDFYEEFRDDYNSLAVGLTQIINKINQTLDNWSSIIEKKMFNPFETIIDRIGLENSVIEEYSDLITKVNLIINKHNRKIENYKKEVDEQKRKLEIHYAYEAVKKFNFLSKIQIAKSNNNKMRELDQQIKQVDVEINKLQSLLSNEVLGSTVFNQKIHSFLGRNDLTLRFDEKSKGYRIIRNDKHAKNLSEGEKTAIAFIYFITKLKESRNDIRESIIVVDDPVSSFDSNNLFHAYSFLKNECQEAKQLFVLTHNFVFYKLLRDWLINKNKGNKMKSRFYTIETYYDSADNQRQSRIVNANDTLLSYQSEYHYLFSKVYQYREKQELTIEEAFLIANISRKLLEGFLSFKFPRKRNEFRVLMEEATRSFSDSTIVEKIYRFINKYSHNKTIEIGDESLDNLLGESHNVVKDILDVINNLDPTHYEEMESILINQTA